MALTEGFELLPRVPRLTDLEVPVLAEADLAIEPQHGPWRFLACCEILRRMDEGDRPADPATPTNPLPWPLSQFDTSPRATSRRQIKLFHVVLLLLAGGSGLVVLGEWMIVPLIIGIAAYVAVIKRGGYPDLVEGVNRLGTQLTETYAEIERTNKQIQDAHKAPSNENP